MIVKNLEKTNQKNFIIITSINAKTQGVSAFEKIPGWHVVLVGDVKTPTIESNDSLTFLSIEDQLKLGFESPGLSPKNHYSRKNIGYLYAISCGANLIYDTDDDNLPYPDWDFPQFSCDSCYGKSSEYANIYSYFTNKHIWPRGFPLDRVLTDSQATVYKADKPVEIGVWQGLADNDPDVDAIYRLIIGDILKFDKKPPVYLGQNTYCPFNSQNTLWRKESFSWLYLPSKVSFRFTDILRGYVAQRLLWAQGFRLGFTSPTVYQERNAHDIMKDFRDEIECYLNVDRTVDLLNNLDCSKSETSLLLNAYHQLGLEDIVGKGEVELVEAWLRDFEKAQEMGVKLNG